MNKKSAFGIPLRFTFASLALLALIAGCGKKEEAKPPAPPATQITVANAKTMDLPVTETATGAETALGFALDYDPTRVAGKTFYVRLSFPEHVATQLRLGQSVRLTSFGDETKPVSGTIREIRPSLSATTLSREVIVVVPNSGAWRPQGSIQGEVTLGIHQNAVVVPEQAVVLRPAGTVVYVVDNGVAREQRVATGLMREGLVEITTGLQRGTTVAVDGASLLSDGAKVNVREAGTATGGKAS